MVELVTETCTSEETDQLEQQQQPQKMALINPPTLEQQQDQQQPLHRLQPSEEVTEDDPLALEQEQDQHHPLQHPQDISSSSSSHVGSANRVDCSPCSQRGIEQALQLQHRSLN